MEPQRLELNFADSRVPTNVMLGGSKSLEFNQIQFSDHTQFCRPGQVLASAEG